MFKLIILMLLKASCKIAVKELYDLIEELESIADPEVCFQVVKDG